MQNQYSEESLSHGAPGKATLLAWLALNKYGNFQESAVWLPITREWSQDVPPPVCWEAGVGDAQTGLLGSRAISAFRILVWVCFFCFVLFCFVFIKEEEKAFVNIYVYILKKEQRWLKPRSSRESQHQAAKPHCPVPCLAGWGDLGRCRAPHAKLGHPGALEP